MDPDHVRACMNRRPVRDLSTVVDALGGKRRSYSNELDLVVDDCISSFAQLPTRGYRGCSRTFGTSRANHTTPVVQSKGPLTRRAYSTTAQMLVFSEGFQLLQVVMWRPSTLKPQCIWLCLSKGFLTASYPQLLLHQHGS